MKTTRQSVAPARESAHQRPQSSQLEVQAFRLLKRLAEPGVEAERGTDQISLLRGQGGAMAIIGEAPRDCLAPLVESGAVTCRMVGGRPRFAISEAGRAALFRHEELRGGVTRDAIFARQHHGIAPQTARVEAVPRVTQREDPLAMLARQKDGFARDFIGEAALEAGKRLAADMDTGMLQPRMGVDFGRVAVGGAPPGGTLNLSERAMTARDRVRRALDAVGPDHAGLLMDICGFSRGLEQVEAARHLPARSAKLWLGLALRALARHYGLADEARGKAQQPIRAVRD